MSRRPRRPAWAVAGRRLRLAAQGGVPAGGCGRVGPGPGGALGRVRARPRWGRLPRLRSGRAGRPGQPRPDSSRPVRLGPFGSARPDRAVGPATRSARRMPLGRRAAPRYGRIGSAAAGPWSAVRPGSAGGCPAAGPVGSGRSGCRAPAGAVGAPRPSAVTVGPVCLGLRARRARRTGSRRRARPRRPRPASFRPRRRDGSAVSLVGAPATPGRRASLGAATGGRARAHRLVRLLGSADPARRRLIAGAGRPPARRPGPGRGPPATPARTVPARPGPAGPVVDAGAPVAGSPRGPAPSSAPSPVSGLGAAAVGLTGFAGTAGVDRVRPARAAAGGPPRPPRCRRPRREAVRQSRGPSAVGAPAARGSAAWKPGGTSKPGRCGADRRHLDGRWRRGGQAGLGPAGRRVRRRPDRRWSAGAGPVSGSAAPAPAGGAGRCAGTTSRSPAAPGAAPRRQPGRRAHRCGAAAGGSRPGCWTPLTPSGVGTPLTRWPLTRAGGSGSAGPGQRRWQVAVSRRGGAASRTAGSGCQRGAASRASSRVGGSGPPARRGRPPADGTGRVVLLTRPVTVLSRGGGSGLPCFTHRALLGRPR